MLHNTDNFLSDYARQEIDDWDETYQKSLPDSIRESTLLLSDVDSEISYLP